MVGSIVTTVEEGQHVSRGQEFGYFAFGRLSHPLLLNLSKLTRLPIDVTNQTRRINDCALVRKRCRAVRRRSPYQRPSMPRDSRSSGHADWQKHPTHLTNNVLHQHIHEYAPAIASAVVEIGCFLGLFSIVAIVLVLSRPKCKPVHLV